MKGVRGLKGRWECMEIVVDVDDWDVDEGGC